MDRCPGLEYWRPFASRPYLVFVDESFRGFFEFERRGYFVHGAFGVPEQRYEDLKTALKPIFDDFRTLTSPGAPEFKHAEFKRIDYRERMKLACRLRDVFKANGAFIAGFYSPLESVVLERCRVNAYFDGQTELPKDLDKAYAIAEAELKGEVADQTGQAKVVAKLLTLPVIAVANVLASLECEVTLVYDPRERKEDRVVASIIDGYLTSIEALKSLKSEVRGDLKGFVKDFVYNRKSEDESGLQMADLVAGEVREFFVANPLLLEEASSPRLITPTSVEPVMTTVDVDGVAFKTGVLTNMRPSLQRMFTKQDPSKQTVLPLLRPLLAAGILTCFAKFGTPRDLMPFDAVIWDQME